MKISKSAQRDARQLFRCCQVDGLLDAGRVRQAVTLVLVRKPHGYLQILTRLCRLVKLDVDQHTASVESAAPLPADLQADVAGRLRKIYGAGVEILFSQDRTLLGGLRVKVGSDLYDGSIRARLENLEQSF